MLQQAEEDLQTQRNMRNHYFENENDFRFIAAKEAVLKLKGRIQVLKEILQ